MEISHFNYRKSKITWTIVLLIFMQSLLLSVNAHRTTGIATDLHLSSEKREIERFCDDLLTFNNQVFDLSKKNALTSAEISTAQSSGNGLKQRITNVQQQFRSVISKLKAANRWNTLDADLLAATTDSEARAILQREGGAKKILDELANNLGSLNQEIDSNVQSLNSKARAQAAFPESESPGRVVRVAYQPAPVALRSLGCIVQIGIYFVCVLDGHTTPERFQKLKQACKPTSPAQ